MAVTIKTPGVYVEERSSFPNSVVEVATAVPVFIGHTEKAQAEKEDLLGKPTRITSLSEYASHFGGSPAVSFAASGLENAGAPPKVTLVEPARFLLPRAIRHFYANGGGTAYILSVGSLDAQVSSDDLSKPLADDGVLAREPEPTLICVPDAVLLPFDGWKAVANAALDHCGRTGRRFALIDIYEGNKARTGDVKKDIIDGSERGLRPALISPSLSYGAAYYPWLNTQIVPPSEVGLNSFEAASTPVLADYLLALADDEPDESVAERLRSSAHAIKGDGAKGAPKQDSADKSSTEKSAIDPEKAHQTAISLSTDYKALMDDALEQLNLLPPSPAIAGIYTRVDDREGVWTAPANTPLMQTASLTVTISADQQGTLNVSRDGKSVNAIRDFVGEGILVWGARTLDGNSADWRYVNVRRYAIMLEQSTKDALNAFVFAPNDANTWTTIKSMIENFLSNQWKAGALAGSTPSEAYTVEVGLGSTMTAGDILEGRLRVLVRVALVRPAEFVVMNFDLQMQKS